MKIKLDVNTGDVFGRLTVIGKPEKRGNFKFYPCICKCGNKCTVNIYKLNSGHTRSCGCLQKETVKNMSTKHGFRYHPLYNTWAGMKKRCDHPSGTNKEWYKGITYCDSWKSFENFLADMGERPSVRHSLGRIDNALGYTKENCRWENDTQQVRNRKRFSVKYEHPDRIPGVVFNKKEGVWRAHITIDYRRIHLGRFKSIYEAIEARRDAEKEYNFWK